MSYSDSESDSSYSSSYVSSRRDQSTRLRGTSVTNDSGKGNHPSIVHYTVPRGEENEVPVTRKKKITRTRSQDKKTVLRESKITRHGGHNSHSDDYGYSESSSVEISAPHSGSNSHANSRASDKRSNRGVEIVNGKCGSCYSNSVTGSKFSEGSRGESESENDSDINDQRKRGKKKRGDYLSVSFSEDNEIVRPKQYLNEESHLRHVNRGMYEKQKIDNGKEKSRKKTGVYIPENQYAVTVDVQPFQLSIPRTPSPPPVRVTPKLKTKTVKCAYEEPPILKYKTAIIDIGEKVKEEPPDEIVVVHNDPPEYEEIPPSPIGECVLRYHLPPSPEPEPVIEPIPTPPPPPYKPPKFKNNPIVTRVGGGWMQIDHHRRNHIPLTVYNRQRYDGSDSYLYIKSKYVTNRAAPPIKYKNKKNLLEKLQRETDVVFSN